ncbi:6296_t:CDS:1, partial [Entrophospora sp. SA101]
NDHKKHYLRDCTNSPRTILSKHINIIHNSIPQKKWPFNYAFDNFLSKHNSHLITICDFLVWRIHNSICLPVESFAKESSQFKTSLHNLQNAENWTIEEINVSKKVLNINKWLK